MMLYMVNDNMQFAITTSVAVRSGCISPRLELTCEAVT